MNERIEELAEQSFFETEYNNAQNLPETMKRFAELIIQECAQVAHNKQYKHSPAHTVGDCATAIKEHFGVEG